MRDSCNVTSKFQMTLFANIQQTHECVTVTNTVRIHKTDIKSFDNWVFIVHLIQLCLFCNSLMRTYPVTSRKTPGAYGGRSSCGEGVIEEGGSLAREEGSFER